MFVAGAQTNFQRLQSFGPPLATGSQPYGQLVENSDGSLFGTCYVGGVSNQGAIFRLDKEGNNFGVVWSFSVGTYPLSGLVADGEYLFGTTSAGGSNDAGTVFMLNRNGTGFKLLHEFSDGTLDGGRPAGKLLIAVDGMLYGTTSHGGVSNQGTVFKLSADGSGYSTIHEFTGTSNGDGSNPYGGLLQGADGLLYGTTQNGGSSNLGAVFRMGTNGDDFLVLHSFGGMTANDGKQPLGELLQGSHGMIYGTTFYGGSDDGGTVFELNTNGGGYGILRSFSVTDAGGYRPSAGLVEGEDGMLYGTAQLSDAAHNFAGTVFKMNKDGSGYTILHGFTGADGDGNQPHSALLEGSDGAFYGVTAYGGDANLGTVFRVFFTPTIKITSVSRSEAGTLLKVEGGAAGQSYNIQATTNLGDNGSWQVIGTTNAAIDGTFQFLDTASGYRTRFYRSAAP